MAVRSMGCARKALVLKISGSAPAQIMLCSGLGAHVPAALYAKAMAYQPTTTNGGAEVGCLSSADAPRARVGFAGGRKHTRIGTSRPPFLLQTLTRPLQQIGRDTEKNTRWNGRARRQS